MLIFSQYLREALKNFSGIKITTLIAGWAFLLYLGINGPVARIVNKYSSFRSFAEEIKQVSGNRHLYNYHWVREDLLYYLDVPVEEVFSVYRLKKPEALLIVKKSHGPEWLETLPEQKIIFEMTSAFEPYLLIGKP